MFTYTTTCVGVAVKAVKKEVTSFMTKKTPSGKVLIGVPYQGHVPFDTIRNYLIDNGIVEDADVIGNCSFLQKVAV